MTALTRRRFSVQSLCSLRSPWFQLPEIERPCYTTAEKGMQMKNPLWMFAIVYCLLHVTSAQAAPVFYYVGTDSRTTPANAPAAEGGGAYPNNPNQGRLSLLFYHGDHFHGIGTYTYSGPAANPTMNDTNANNRLPESSTGLAPISLLPGSGDWMGTWRTGLPSSLPQDVEYGDLEIRNVHSLATEDPITYNSSSNRWNGDFSSAHIHLELVSKTHGLNVSLTGLKTNDLVQPGDDWHLGDGDEMFSVTPTFWVDGTAQPGTIYSAEFRLTNLSDIGTNSGRFSFDFQVVPEPASGAAWSLLLVGLRRIRRCHG